MRTETSGAKQMRRGQFSFQLVHSSFKKKGEGSRGNINLAQQQKLHSQQTNVPVLMHPATVDISGSKQN